MKRVVFAAQGRSLELFYRLHQTLKFELPIEKAGYLIADSSYYREWKKTHPDFENENTVVKEWETLSRRNEKPNLELLRDYERKLGGEGLFSAIVADRRLFMGPDCTYTEDNRRRFSDDELWMILQLALQDVEKMFDTVRPQLAMSFICVTIFDYLIYLFARARGVPFLNLRSTRIQDYVLFSSSLADPSREFEERLHGVLKNGSPKLEEAKRFLAQFRGERTYYEGTVPASDKPALQIKAKDSLIKSVGRQLAHWKEHYGSESRHDNHVPDPIRAMTYGALLNPIRARYHRSQLKHDLCSLEDIKKFRYAFYPLHTEPEVSILVYGRPFFSQIEVIRAYASALPADMVLAVKEHPWMIGKRNLESYRQLLNIPRVRLVKPAVDALELVKGSTLVTTLSGSTGLEAIFLKKPVVSLGHVPFNVFPANMVRRVTDLHKLPREISELIETHSHQENWVEAYVAATMEMGARVQLYSVLLGRSFSHSLQSTSFDREIRSLADHVLERSKAVLDPSEYLRLAAKTSAQPSI